MNWLETVRRCFDVDRVLYSQHARKEMVQETLGAISDQEVHEAICNIEIVEEYPRDKPYPSVLLFGLTGSNRPLHIVCAYAEPEDLVVVITVYQPDPERWLDYRRRQK